MEQLRFRAGSEVVLVRYHRRTKSAYICTSKTNYREVKIPWKYLFDKGKERIQEKITDKLDDYHFRLAVTSSMIQQGYMLDMKKKDGT